MNFPRLFIKDKHPLIDFAYYGSKARRAAHPDVLLGGYTECPMFREGDILDANAVLNLVKCVRWNEWASQEKLEKHIEDTIIHVTQEDRDRWDNNSFVQSDWNEQDDTSYAYIKNKPDVYTKDDVYTKTIIDQMLATKADINLLSNVAISGDYNDLINKPTIPTIPTNVSAFVNDAGYLTEHQDISGKADKADLSSVAMSGSYNDLTNKPTIPSKLSELQSDSTHRVVQDSQINNWNDKQDAIGDLGTIRTGAGLGATALQPSALDDYYNKNQVDTKLGSKQNKIDNLATIEAGAAKGATSLQPSDKGVANGVATLNENGIIPSSQLPSYVDDVLEYESSAEFPVTGESGKIYVDLFTNKTYRWGGSGYVEISQSLALGETSSTAYAGDKGKATTDAFNAHAANTDIHVTAAKQAAWDAKADVSYVEDNYLKNYIETDPTGGHDYVEIGGIKWATMNIGAESVTDYGLYFQWGDTQGYTAEQVGSGTGQKYFGWADYKYGNGTSDPGAAGMTKYNSSDYKTVLDASDDAVTAAWGNNWRMPTTAEFKALSTAVNTEWTNDYQGSGVKGLVCTDKTDSSKVLFFPATGSCSNGSVSTVGSLGTFLSSSRSRYSYNVHQCYGLNFNRSDVYWQNDSYRYVGRTVRGVYIGSIQRIPVSGVTETEKTTWNNKSDFSGSYNDLTDKPTIPTVAQSDWNQTDNTAIDYIKNKPTIPSIWTGTQAQYDAIATKDPDTIYIIKSTS